MKIRTWISLLITGSLFLSCSKKIEYNNDDLNENIRINQLGYFPGLEKSFTLADSLASEFMIVGMDGKVKFRSELEEFGVWEPSGEYLKLGDFSEYSMPGEYFIHVPGTGNSWPFRIAGDLYKEAAVAGLETFYFMRVSMPMEEKYLGSFARPMGHPDDTCWFHESTGYSEGFISSPGGWYDAGDYGKYIVNASISTATMLTLFELFPDIFPDGSLNIPEKANGVSDILDEMRYEFDWVLTMQDKDGGVFHKLTPLRHDGVTMPHETHSKRYIIGKSTSASLDFAAMLAQASRIYRNTDPGFSAGCLEAAKKAYQWALDNPEEYYLFNPRGINTGNYGDRKLEEEFFWAAAELYCTTGEQQYYDQVKDKIGDMTFRLAESWRNYVDNIGYYSLYLSGRVTGEDKEKLEAGIIRVADSLIESASRNPYGIPVERFEWGSNSDVLNTAIVELFAHHVSGDMKYLDAAATFTDYIFGKNATAYSFVSGFGSRYSQNFHHRLLMADDNDESFPGFVAGGPNGFMHDRRDLRQAGIDYPDTIAAKAYIDHPGSYASNEVCINWNAPLVFVLGYIENIEK